MDLGLTGKVALVTGASQGLGFATASLLAQEGARMVINSRNEQKLESAVNKIRAAGGTAVAAPGDVSDPAIAAQLVNTAVSSFGGLDILITNSGGPRPGRFESLNDADWARAVELCLMVHVRLIRAGLPMLKRSSTPSVLTITSLSVKQPIENLILSNSVRSATIGLTKSLALELASTGIRFNSILPSWTETERVTELLSARAQTNGTTLEQEFARQAKESPLGRMARPEEFAAAAVFLVSPAASYLTGVMLPVDGGSYKGTF